MRHPFSDLLDSIDRMYDKADIEALRTTLLRFKDDMQRKSKEDLLAFLPELTYLSPFHRAFAPVSKAIWDPFVEQGLLGELKGKDTESFLRFIHMYPHYAVNQNLGTNRSFWSMVLQEDSGRRIWREMEGLNESDEAFEKRTQKTLQEQFQAQETLFGDAIRKVSDEEKITEFNQVMEKHQALRKTFYTLNAQRKEGEAKKDWIYSDLDLFSLIVKGNSGGIFQEWPMIDHMVQKGASLSTLSDNHTRHLFELAFVNLDKPGISSKKLLDKLYHWGLRPLTDLSMKDWQVSQPILAGDDLRQQSQGQYTNTEDHRWRWVVLEMARFVGEPLNRFKQLYWYGEKGDKRGPMRWANDHGIGPFTSLDILKAMEALKAHTRLSLKKYQGDPLVRLQQGFVQQHQIQTQILPIQTLQAFFSHYSFTPDLIRALPKLGIELHTYDIHNKALLAESILTFSPKGEVACMQALLDTFQSDSSERQAIFHANIEGKPLLHSAILFKRLEMLDWMVSQGANLNLQDAQGDTPFHVFCNHLSSSPKAMVDWVLFFKHHQMDGTLQNKKSKTAFHLIPKRASSKNIEALLPLMTSEILSIKDAQGHTFWNGLQGRKEEEKLKTSLEKLILTRTLNAAPKTVSTKPRI